jgi:c-di-GMP-binding flagellar brake protein YcgR
MDNRRGHDRVKISFPVECSLPTARQYFYTVSKDLSQGGVKIFSDNFIPRGNNIKVNINLIDCVLSFNSKVAWCNKERVSDRYVTGLQFVDTNKTAEADLSRFLNRVCNA